MSWITNPIGQAFGLITKNQNAKQAAAYTQQIISEVTTDLANFSTDMAKVTSAGFAAQYKLYQEALSSYKGVSREAIQEQYKFLEIYSGEIGTYADKIVENLQIDPTTLNELVSLYYSAGENAAKAFIEGVYNASQNGNVEEAVTISLKELYDANSAARKDLEKTWQQQYKNELAKYKDYIDLDPIEDEHKLRTQAAALGWSETDPYIILNKMKTKYAEVGTAEQFINKQLDETKNKLLSLISPYEDSLSAIQAAQALSSKNENVKKYIEEALSGGLTPENLQDILSDSAYNSVKEELVQAFIAGDIAKVASLLSTGVSGNVNEYTEVFDGRLNRLKSELEIATDETRINALKEEIVLIESIIANQGQLNEKKLNAIVYDKKLSALQKDIESGAKGSAEALEKFLNAEIAVNKELIKTSVKNAGFTNVEEITKYLEQLYDGTLT